MWYFVSASSRLEGERGLDHVLQDVGPKLLGGDGLGMLSGNDHGVDPDGVHILVVFHRHLALAIGPEIRKQSALAHLGQFLAELVGQRDRRWQQVFVLVGCVAEHHALVAGSAGVYAHGDIAGLLIDAGDDGAGIRVEAVKCVIVADRGHHAAHQGLEVDVCLGRDLAGNDHQAGGGKGFARHTAEGILREAGIEDRVGNLVGDLIGMPFGHRLGRKKKSIVLWQSSFLLFLISCRHFIGLSPIWGVDRTHQLWLRILLGLLRRYQRGVSQAKTLSRPG